MDRFTYQDAIDHVVDYLGGGMSDVVARDARRAVLAAYRDLPAAHQWTHLFRHGRIITAPPYSAGTVVYDESGGSVDRVMTLTGGSWPSWAARGTVRIGDGRYRVSRRISNTEVQIDAAVRPTGDLASTSYTIYQESYPLPEDYTSQHQAGSPRNFGGLKYVHPSKWLTESDNVGHRADARVYTVMEDALNPPGMAFVLWPVPASSRTIDFIYKRKPRPLVEQRTTAGSLAITLGSPTITASSTVFTDSMVGSVVRAYSGTTLQPGGGHVYAVRPAYESVIQSVASGTVAVCQGPSLVTLSTAPWYVSDPIDVDYESMLNVFQRCCEHQVSLTRTLKDKPSAGKAYRDALDLARDADSRSLAGRVAGVEVSGWNRWEGAIGSEG